MRFLDERPGSIAVISITSDQFTSIVGIHSEESCAWPIESTKQSGSQIERYRLKPAFKGLQWIHRPHKGCTLGNEQTIFGDVVFELQAEGASCVIIQLCVWGKSWLFYLR